MMTDPRSTRVFSTIAPSTIAPSTIAASTIAISTIAISTIATSTRFRSTASCRTGRRSARAAAVVLAALWIIAAPLQAQDRTAFHADAESVRPLLPGMAAPALALTAIDGTPVSFTPGELGAPLVLTFYRGGWCPYCNLHLAELRTAEAELKQLGFEVWFVSPDRPELLAEGESAGYGYRLLADPDLGAARAFGIAFRLDESTLERYAGFGLDLAERSGAEHGGLPAPATFLIGADGIVQFAYVNPDYSVRLAPEVLLAAARAYTDDAHRRLKRER